MGWGQHPQGRTCQGGSPSKLENVPTDVVPMHIFPDMHSGASLGLRARK